jgi:hypothetical protein
MPAVIQEENSKNSVTTERPGRAQAMQPGTLMIQPAICYEHILRAIGQGLESLSLESFDLEIAENIFSVRGIPTQKKSEKSPVTKLKAFKKAFLGICLSSRTPAPTTTSSVRVPGSSRLLRLQFTQADIDKLERDGQALRSDWERSPLSHSLPQVLRTVGWYVDRKKGQIHKISKTADTLSVSYTGLLGTQKFETLTLVQIYDMWVHLYKQRKGNIITGPQVSLC